MGDEHGRQTPRVHVGRRETVAHVDEECTWEGSTETLSPEEAREKGYTACLKCLPEGWPDDQ